MNSFKIKVPATSANFGIGFDTLGVALDIYNEFEFDKSDSDVVLDFDSKFNNSNNLVLTSYKRFFTYFNIEYIPVTIKLIKNEVPESRGLGSSATCIVAGVLAANKIAKANKSSDALLRLMTSIEGHPDNVAPAFLGGFVASTVSDNIVYPIKYNVSNKLIFNVYISPFKLSTEEARKVLPLSYLRSDVVHNLSRIVNLPYALEYGNYELLKVLLKDKIHEPYRIEIIEHAKELFEKINIEGAIPLISGSGSTILSISNKDIIVLDNYYKQRKVQIDTEGAFIYD